MSDVEAQIREAYEFYLLDSDRSAGEIFAQQVGQILAADNQEDTTVPVCDCSPYPNHGPNATPCNCGESCAVQRVSRQPDQVLVRNKAGFPWYVQLSPTQVETP